MAVLDHWMFPSDDEEEEVLDFRKRKRGPKPLTDRHPEIVQAVKDFIEDNSAEAHNRRRDKTSFSHGVSLADIRRHVLQTVPSVGNISIMTIHRMMQPANRASRNAKRHSGIVDARVPRKRNDSTKTHPDFHYTCAAVNYANELVSLCDSECVGLSCDDKNKVNVGTLAVSRHFQMKKYFSTNDAPNFPDHDFPFPDSKITPSGYMQLKKKGRSRSLNRETQSCKLKPRCRSSSPIRRKSVVVDKKGREHVSWPRTGPLDIFLHAARFHSSNSGMHAEHLLDILRPLVEDPISPKTVVSILADGGPDWSTKSVANLLNYGKLWRDLGLDGLIVMSYAPRHSRYNPIERAWAPLSKWLAGVTLPRTLEGESLPPSQQQGMTDEEKLKKEIKVFDNAIAECGKYWTGRTFDSHAITVHAVPSSVTECQHHVVKDFVNAPKKRLSSSKYRQQRRDLCFLTRHCVRRTYQIEFYKCTESSCTYCTQNPIRAQQFFEVLKKFGGRLPSPVRDSARSRGEYMTFIRLLENPLYVQRESLDCKLPSGRFGHCDLGCRYTFLSKADIVRHNKLIHPSK